MVVDPSALVAIVFNEPDGPAFREAILASDSVFIAAPSVVEFIMVALGRKGPEGEAVARSIMELGNIQIASFDAAHAALAQDGFRRYGKGRHPAKLNLGDCFSYALAKSLGEPLLFKGEDFRLTDVTPAL
jgi:ribonuclease VapC